jgi:hypothetical protein
MSVVPPPMVFALVCRVRAAHVAPFGAPPSLKGFPARPPNAPLSPDMAQHSSAIC